MHASTNQGCYGVYVGTTKYHFYHGQMPKGHGGWVFQVGGETRCFRGTYGVAKRQAIRAAVKLGLHEIEVLP